MVKNVLFGPIAKLITIFNQHSQVLSVYTVKCCPFIQIPAV